MTGRLIVEPPMEEAELVRRTTPEERAAAAAFRPTRRREYLAWRAVVRRELGAGIRIAYDVVGAPVLIAGKAPADGGPADGARVGTAVATGSGGIAPVVDGPDGGTVGCPDPAVTGRGGTLLSVAHCPGRIAVRLAPHRCAVDIESETRDVSRILTRVLTPEERALSDDPTWPVTACCAKEALYKYAGCPGLSLRDDLHLDEADLAAGRLTGRVASGAPVELKVLRREGFVVVCI